MTASFPGYLLQILPFISLTLATLSIYWPVGNFEFINYDDGMYVSENPKVQAGLNSKNILWAFTTTETGNWYPLTWLSHMLACELFGLNPGPHHLINLFFHLANTLLLFWVLKRMTGRPWVSLFVAALFALHPLRVEPVAWIADRKGLLSAFFWILTMGMYARYAEKPGRNLYLWVILFFTLGLMSKPMVVTLPFALLLLDYWPLRRFSLGQSSVHLATSASISQKGKPPATQPNPPPHHFGKGCGEEQKEESSLSCLVLEKAPLFLLSAAWSVMTFFTHRGAGTVISLETLPIETRLSNSIVFYARYLEKMIRPYDLAILYPYPDRILLWQVALASISITGISVLVFRWARSQPYLAVGWLWYLGTLVPVIGLTQAGPQAMADRFTYIPLIGIFIMLAMGVPDLLKGWGHRKIALTLSAGLVLSFFSLVTRQQVHLWKNSITLFEHTLSVTAKNWIIHNNLGVVFDRKGKDEQAAFHYNQALQFNPDYAEAHNNLGIILAQLGKFQEAVVHYNQALRIKPNYAEARNNLGNALAQLGKFQEAAAHYYQALQIKLHLPQTHNNLGIVLAQLGKLQEATAHYNQALQIKPDFLEAHNNLGIVLAQLGKFQEAAAHHSRALQIKPDSPEALINLGNALAQLGKTQEAAAHYSRALKIKPDFPEAHNNLGNTLAQLGKTQEAAAHYSRALQIKPDYAEAHNNLGNILILQGEIQEAVAHYKQAIRIKPDFPEAQNNLGKALAQLGKEKEAIEHFSGALESKGPAPRR